jgi:hypothetical protein
VEVKIDLAAIIERVRKAAELELVNNTNRATRSVVLDLLNSGRYGDKEGLAHEIIRKKVEDFILSDTYTKLIDEVIEQNMREEAASAVKTLLNSKIRKSLFQPTSPIESERDLSEWVIVMDGSPDKLVWGDALGWVAFEDSHLYNRYTADQKNDVLLPMGGIWYRIPERK